LKGVATDVHHALHSPLTRLIGKVLCLEKVEPQILVGLHPQVPLTDRHKDGGLRDRVGGEVMEFYLLVIQEQPHELARQHPEPPLVESNKAHHVALRGRRLPVAGRRHPLLRLAPTRPR
jgi:hypothetical protein